MGSSGTDDFIIPTWLNAEFLSDVLSKEKNTDISVIDFSAKAAVPKGNNYLSVLYRIVAQYKESKKQDDISKSFLIVKTLPTGELLQNFLLEIKGFEKEERMYKKVLPFIYETMKSVTGSIHPLSARSLPCSVEGTLVLEDLQHLGYRMANRHNGLDLDHCKIVVRAIARFHVYSLELCKSDPSIMDDYADTLYDRPEEKSMDMEVHTDVNLKFFASEIEKWPGYEHYAPKIRNLIPKAVGIMREAVLPKKNSFNVLNHGDCWTNNMMFLYCPETGKVEDVRFVDFQLARYSSPALDLQYFICNCPSDEVRYDYREALLEEYHSELTNTLKILKYDPNMFTLQQLKDEFAEKDEFGLITACTVLVVIIAEQDAAPKLNELKEDPAEKGDTPMASAYAGKRYRELMQKLLPFYEQKGLL